MDLNIQQKAAIKAFLNYISTSMVMKWDRNRLFSYFEDYELNTTLELDFSDYLRTINRLPIKVKRDFICKLLNSWSDAGHSDHYTLYQTLQDLLHQKIETGVECVLFNNILNLSTYLGISNYSIEATVEGGYYDINVYYDDIELDSYDSQVCFETSGEDEQPFVEYDISAPLLRKKINLSTPPPREDVLDLLNILKENHTKKHCPWIHLDYSTSCDYLGGIAPHLHIRYSDIHYIDNHGV